ncbi:GAF domain-containing protein [Haloferax mediterranei ATCC 33500]|uniref:histidine kinase n=1 Tax=Haloferax mediterranei (strain ATCC 33500 / DSM 1411 / JCM 8866 / NBRC 14739 / NCIMB 2177 / R-4) TaxID=523841 RepID=I3R137_HALMT|nr:GAF domain-containing protein [Haloferax mediterranei]AFK17947.1 PAS domain S-box [Haloferax mediterranei ATCC 33500]AHZ22631.1 histidine kinase [Haloferax mediterranei ATCC 33500]EMA02775.1 PAS domain-containing protein [Haloferax mediterranei ATCC 33500]MDX5988040.1 GAF domain-containing protein [Haloferax mediterranei ATCC 33500]QCQ74500.1 GAF domain-containing protein [Haloferax mediterranei ATCC 33500]
MHATEPTVLVDDDFDDTVDLGNGVTVAPSSDGRNVTNAACVVVSNSDAMVSDDVATILYTDERPEAIERPERFDAYVRRGDRSGLESQIRWVLARCDNARESTASDDDSKDDGSGVTQSRTGTVRQNTNGTVRQNGTEATAQYGARTDGQNDTEWDRLKRLYEGTTNLITAETVDELYDRAIELTEHILEFDNTLFLVHEDDGFYVTANDHELAGTGPIPSETGLLAKTYQSKESSLIDNVRDHPAATPNDPAYRSALSVPMGDDGVFQAISNEVGAYDETDLRLAELLVSYVSETRARIESESAVRKSREQIERLHRGATELAAATSLTELFDQTVEITDDILEFDISYVGIVEDGYIIPTAISSHAPANAAEHVPLESGGVAAEVYQSGEKRIIDDVRDYPGSRPVKRMYRSALSVPIGDIGVFQATSFTPAAFDEQDVELAELLMAHVAVTAERIRAEARLREERDRSNALFEHVSDAAVAYDVEAGAVTVRDVNRAFQTTFGYDSTDVVGSDLLGRIIPLEAEADPVPDPDVEETIPELLVATGESYRGEVCRRTEDGVREFILNVVPLSPGEERGSGYAIYTDITERKTRESELERQNERLEEFANIVSHDLRNPLGVARGNLQLARETGSDERFDTAETALEQMGELIDDLLSLARRGQLVDETSPINLGHVARRAWDSTETVDAQLTTAQSVVVDADEDRLAELLANLFRNAVEHGGEDVRIDIGSLDDGFYVEDDGPGIEPDRRDKVFKPGETTGENGIGYGLAIVESIAEAHGWSVSVTSGPLGGARFEFRS